MANERQTQIVVVKNSHGLHVRPAEVVARAAMQFESQISLELEGHKIDAKSILHIMTLGARQGSEVLIEALGSDAQRAVQRMAEVIGAELEDGQDDSVSQDQAG